jgi:uncharacterized protein (DUF1778 family)
MDTTLPPTKSERIEARVTEGMKATVLRAAALEGRSLSDFVIDALAERAERVIQEREILSLNDEARAVFFDALLQPPAPNAAMQRAAERHRALIGDRR